MKRAHCTGYAGSCVCIHETQEFTGIPSDVDIGDCWMSFPSFPLNPFIPAESIKTEISIPEHDLSDADCPRGVGIGQRLQERYFGVHPKLSDLDVT